MRRLILSALASLAFGFTAPTTAQEDLLSHVKASVLILR